MKKTIDEKDRLLQKSEQERRQMEIKIKELEKAKNSAPKEKTALQRTAAG